MNVRKAGFEKSVTEHIDLSVQHEDVDIDGFASAGL